MKQSKGYNLQIFKKAAKHLYKRLQKVLWARNEPLLHLPHLKFRTSTFGDPCMYITFENLKKCAIYQSYKGVAQKLSLLRPFQFSAVEGYDRPNFHAIPS